MNKKHISVLTQLFNHDQILFDEINCANYSCDLSVSQSIIPTSYCVVFPKNNEEVIECVRFANIEKISLVPSGGRTGLSGGAVANENQIVVSFEKMNRVLEYNSVDQTIYCEVGITLETVQQYALKQNLIYPIDFATSATCQLGGNIATNAGGIHVVRYGSTRDWVRGLTVVTGSGDVLHCNQGLIKNSSGYDFRHLFIGSEGTLGFITEAILKFTTPPESTQTILFSLHDQRQLMSIFSQLQKLVPIIAFEFFSDFAMQCVMAENRVENPLQKNFAFYVIFEYEVNIVNQDKITDLFHKLIKEKIIFAVCFSGNKNEAERLWQYRKGISSALKKYSPCKFDIAVTPSKIAEFISSVNELLKNKYATMIPVCFGHIGDGNIHLNIIKSADHSPESFLNLIGEMKIDIYKLISKYQGTVSAEHGVGLLKKSYLHYSRSQAEIDVMHAIKKIFDPNGIMNPGKLL